jgi:7-carboxy-7-deazaguanine synthase
MAYSIKELYLTLQGEGAHCGRPAVFCRFTGCNLWSGREQDRPTAICRFCDTDFLGTDGEHGGRFETAQDLAETVAALWTGTGNPYVVCTGGEPLLQLDELLINAFHEQGLEIGVETNGTIPVPAGIDWVCVSPKANTKVVVTSGDELKLVYPQLGVEPRQFEHLDFSHFYLQPMDGPSLEQNREMAIRHCQNHGRWRLSMQMHKLLGIR